MKNKVIIQFTSITLIVVSIILVLVILLNGNTTTSGQNPETVKGASLTCESSSTYPIFTYDSSKDKKLKITAGFYDDKINAISLTYELYYDNQQQITASEAHNHAAMNIDFGKHSLNPDSYNAIYSKLDDRMRMALYISSANIDANAARYFMINLDDNTPPSTLAEYQENYETQGFVCKTNNN